MSRKIIAILLMAAAVSLAASCLYCAATATDAVIMLIALMGLIVNAGLNVPMAWMAIKQEWKRAKDGIEL